MRILAALLLLLLAACGEDAALGQLAPVGRGRVVEVLTPDLVMLDDGESVKLAGLAAMPRREPYAAKGRAALEELTLGQEVELLSGGAARDPFDRRVAHLRLVKDGRWVEAEMLEAGAGRVRTFSDNRALARQMLEHEAKARAAKRGLWALPEYQVRLPAEVRRAGGFHIVEGRVTAALRAGRGYELDMQGLEVEIPAHALADFEAADKAPPTLAGRLARVRGTVRRGPSIRLDHPEALEVLTDP